MLNVFVRKSVEELHIQLSDGRMMPLEDLVRDYERLLKEETSKKSTTSEPKEDKSITSKLKVGEWFRIDRDVIDKSKEEIRRKCNEAGDEGMSIEQVQKLLGHIKIDTTMEYAMVNQNNVKNSHRKYVN